MWDFELEAQTETKEVLIATLFPTRDFTSDRWILCSKFRTDGSLYLCACFSALPRRRIRPLYASEVLSADAPTNLCPDPVGQKRFILWVDYSTPLVS